METLFQNVLTASFHGSVVILAVLLLRLLLRKAPKKYVCMLWILAGLRLLLPFQLESKLSLQPEPEAVAQIAIREPSADRIVELPPELMGNIPQSIPSEDSLAEEPVTHTAQPTVQAEIPAEAFIPEEAPPEPEITPTPAVDWAALIPWAWLTVALAFGIYSLQSYLKLKRKVRLAVKIPGGWECAGIETAFILGFIKPKIYIPTGMSREDRRHILAHERTHLEKGDHWIKMLGYIALAVHWFNPLVWLSYILLCRDIEMACDERVVRFMELEDRKRYSAALLHCSTNKAHYAACPVAFGEVNVKQRIMSVLNYRKPGFWISLVSVIAIVFVAVCFLTTPSEEAPEGTEPTVAETINPAEETNASGFASTLTEAEVIYICQQAIEDLKIRENYYITHEYSTTSTSEYYGDYAAFVYIRRAGEDSLTCEDPATFGGRLNFEGQYAWHNGGVWIWEGAAGDPNEWLDAYSPNGKTTSEPKILDGSTVSFYASWVDNDRFQRSYEGTFTFTFDNDGNLLRFTRDYVHHEEDGDVNYHSLLTLQPEDPSMTRAVIQGVALEAMTSEEYDAWLKDLETITEVPSNKTSYDKDFALGAGSKQWQFLQERAHVRIGAEEATATGLTMVYSEADDDHRSLTAGEGYWLEQLVDGTWTMVAEYEAAERAVNVTWTTTDRYQLSWDEPLPGGFYRLGRYHTMALPTGEEETAVCYAKFRLYEENYLELMTEARKAWEDFFNSGMWHIYCIEWMTEHEDMEYYMTEEVWKSGSDYLSDTRYVDRNDSSYLHGRRGGMWRGSTRYDLTWAGDGVNGPVAEWTTNTYMDEVNFTLWSFPFEWYDSQVESVERRGNKLIVQSFYDFSDRYEASQIILTLNDDGTLAGMRKVYLPTRDCKESEMVVDAEVVVLNDSGQQIRSAIDGIDLTVVPDFTWEAEKALLEGAEGVKTKNFVNSTYVTLANAQAAIDRAILDCTLPAEGNYEPGTNMSKAYFDPEAKMWKVEFTASWDDSIYQAVYMTDRGVTVLTSTVRPEANIHHKLPVWLHERQDRLYFVADGEKLDITDLISYDTPFTYIIGGTETAGRKTYVAVGGDYPNFGYLYYYRDYEPGMGDMEGWDSGASFNHWDNEKDEEYPWHIKGKDILGTPFSNAW